MAELAPNDGNPDFIKLFIAFTYGCMALISHLNAAEVSRDFGINELSILKTWSPYPFGATYLKMRSKFGFSQTLHRRGETVWGLPRTLTGEWHTPALALTISPVVHF